MSRVHRVGVIAGSPKGRSYADFLARIATLTANTANSDAVVTTTVCRVNLVSTAHQMTGSSWNGTGGTPNGFQKTTSKYASVVLHGLPDAATYADQVALSRQVYVETPDLAGAAALAAINRNGYTSTSAGLGGSRGSCTAIFYFDSLLGPMQMNPFAGTGPSPYTW